MLVKKSIKTNKWIYKFVIAIFICNCLSFVVYEKSEGLTLTFDYQKTTPLLHPPYVSCVINDPTDPLSTKGVGLTIKENNLDIDVSDFSVALESDHEEIISSKTIHVEKSNGAAFVIMHPLSVGYATIKITVTTKKSSASLLLYVAASKANAGFEHTYWHTSMADASAAIAIDNQFMFVADDEKNQIGLFNRFQSGAPIYTYKYENFLNLEDGEEGNYKEIDCEAAVRSPFDSNKIYWLGSMSNGGKSDKVEKNRNCLFCTKTLGSNENATLTFNGSVKTLRKDILKWGDHYGYELSKAGEAGQNPKALDGFNIEGMCFAPNHTTLYIGCRAPLVPTKNKTKALIIPVLNFEKWFNNGNPVSTLKIDEPIELDLHGKGIRDMIQLHDGSYVIIAGMSNEQNNSELYQWSGLPNEIPILLSTNNLNTINPEAIVEVLNNDDTKKEFQLISDNGKNIYYLDDVKAKYLQPEYKKFRSDIISVGQ